MGEGCRGGGLVCEVDLGVGGWVRGCGCKDVGVCGGGCGGLKNKWDENKIK